MSEEVGEVRVLIFVERSTRYTTKVPGQNEVSVPDPTDFDTRPSEVEKQHTSISTQ